LHDMSEPVKPRMFKVKVGRKGEIYTTREVRELAGIKAPGELLLIIRKDEIVIKRPPSLSEVLRKKPLLKISFEEAERISEKAQREYGL